MINLAGLDLAVWNRVASDAEGAAVRAALVAAGSSADALRMVEDIRRRVVGDPPPDRMPAGVFLALEAGPVSLVERIVSRPIYRWRVMGPPSLGFGALSPFPLLLARAYAAPLTVSGSIVGDLEVSAGARSWDQTLDRLVIPVELAIGGI